MILTSFKCSDRNLTEGNDYSVQLRVKLNEDKSH